MTLDLKDGRPIFIQIKEYIEQGVLSGNFGADEQIPSTNQLVSYFGINPITVMKGIGLLTDEGILYKKRGVGMFVSPGAIDILKKRYAGALSEEFVQPLLNRARALGLTKEELHKILDENWRDHHDRV